MEPEVRTLIQWGLKVGGCDIYFSTKEKAIEAGRMSIKIDPDTKLFEDQRIWTMVPGRSPKLLNERRYYRTILIKDYERLRQETEGEAASKSDAG